MTNVSSQDQLIERFSGGDPIDGTQALHELLTLGDPGEEALFSRPIEFARFQVRRRWLRYVASREGTVVGRLIDRMQNQERFNDAYSAAYLFAGISKNREATRALYAQLDTSFEPGTRFGPGPGLYKSNILQPTSATFEYYDPVLWRLLALGYAGGDPGVLWRYVKDDEFAWEKLRTFAFRGSCAAVARVSEGIWAIEDFVTHEMEKFGLVEISDSPEVRISNNAIDESEEPRSKLRGIHSTKTLKRSKLRGIRPVASEIWLQAYQAFSSWRRGEVADEILRRWSQHAHWRVRNFGAQILASLGFQRTVTPVVKWLRREPVQVVRISLLHALQRSETVSGADALIEHFNSSSQEGRDYLARAAWRASDKNRAVTVLKEIGDAKTAVSLARLGQRHVQLTEMLESHNEYNRLDAALAVAYLGDKNMFDQLVAIQREASQPIERICLAAALAMLGKPNGATELNEELIAAAGMQGDVDFFFLAS